MKSLLLLILVLLMVLLVELCADALEDMYTSKSLLLLLLEVVLLDLFFVALKFSKNSFGMSFKFLLKFYSRPYTFFIIILLYYFLFYFRILF